MRAEGVAPRSEAGQRGIRFMPLMPSCSPATPQRAPRRFGGVPMSLRAAAAAALSPPRVPSRYVPRLASFPRTAHVRLPRGAAFACLPMSLCPARPACLRPESRRPPAAAENATQLLEAQFARRV